VFLPPLAGLTLVAHALPTAVAVGHNLAPLAGLTLVAHALPTAKASRSFDIRDASRQLHLIALDAATGSITAHRAWSAAGASLARTEVGATSDGNFVALNGDVLCVYGPDLLEVDRIALRADIPSARSDWSFWVAPGGRVVFLRQSLGRRLTLRELATSPLREIRSWDEGDGDALASEEYFAKCGEDHD